MRYRLVEMLACPDCDGPLQLEVLATSRNHFAESASYPRCRHFCTFHQSDVAMLAQASLNCEACYRVEIDQGVLTCAECSAWFPIIDGIPRLLPASLRDEMLTKYHLTWMRRYGPSDSEDATAASSPNKQDIIRRTIASYSFQWNTFSEMLPRWEMNFRSYFGSLVSLTDLQGRNVLDVGCGFGRHLFIAAKYGAEVVGVDLSEAVRAAYQNTRQYPQVHIVQGDLYHLPLRACFDLVYCIGVIQHLPNPKAGFLSLVGHLKPGATIFVWVYSKRKGLYRLVDWMRPVTTCLPFPVLYGMTFVLAGLSHALFVLPCRLLDRIPATRGLAGKIPFSGYAQYPLRISHADWFDRLSVPSTVYFSREEVEDWFRSAGLHDVQIVPRHPTGWRGFGVIMM